MQVSLDLTSMMPLGKGASLKFKSGIRIPSEKESREMFVGYGFLHALAKKESASVTNIRSNRDDPPDVLFDWNGIKKGLELTELMPENRRRKDVKLNTLRRGILSAIDRSKDNSDCAIVISFIDDYGANAWIETNGAELGRYLDTFLRDNFVGIVPVPARFAGIVRTIHFIRDVFSDHPLRENPNDPIIQFPAQSTAMIVEDDIPAIVAKALSPKLLRSAAALSWLILWNVHRSLAELHHEIATAMQSVLRSHSAIAYERVFHCSIGSPMCYITKVYESTS